MKISIFLGPKSWLENRYQLWYNHEGNTDEEKNGYVVFKLNIRGSWEKGKGKALLRSRQPFLQQASGQIFEDDVNGFSTTTDIFFVDITCKVHTTTQVPTVNKTKNIIVSKLYFLIDF